jgi:monomeric isocitrate dehydrogenase
MIYLNLLEDVVQQFMSNGVLFSMQIKSKHLQIDISKKVLKPLNFSKNIQVFFSEQVFRKSNAFNAALMCGMSFRQASHIGTEEFWTDKHNEKGS